MYTVEQRVFIVLCYAKHSSYTECRFRFIRKFPGILPPHRSTVRKLVNKFRTTGSVLNKKSRRRRTVLTEEKLDEIGALLERTPTKSLSRLAVQANVSLSSAHKATKLLKAKPYKSTPAQHLRGPDSFARVRYCNWLLQSVHDGYVDPELLFYSDEAWLHLSGYVNSQNNRYWCAENPHQLHVRPLHDVKIGVWCAISARRIIGPIFFRETINADRYIDLILRPFFQELTEEERSNGYFMQDNATAHTANRSMEVIREVFEDRVVNYPPRSPDLNPCDYYLWGMLKGKVYVNNPHTREQLQENITQVISNITRAEIRRVSGNLFTRCQACLAAEGQHFEHQM